MKVRDVMHSDATWFGPETPLARLAAEMREHDADAVPISEYDRLIGVVTQRDLAARGGKAALALSARDVMSKPIIYCYPEEELDDALRIMRKHAVRRLCVVSHQKRILGTVSLKDIPSTARHSVCAGARLPLGAASRHQLKDAVGR